MIHILFGRHCCKAFVCINSALITALGSQYCWVLSYSPCSSAFWDHQAWWQVPSQQLLVGTFFITTCWGECGGKKNFNSLLVGVQHSRVTMSSVWRFLKILKVLSYGPAVLQLAYTQRRTRVLQRRCCTSMGLAALVQTTRESKVADEEGWRVGRRTVRMKEVKRLG